MKNIVQKKQESPVQNALVSDKATLVQPKLSINTPGDRYEQEADRVADAVMGMSEGDTPVLQKMSLSPVSSVQRAANAEGGGGVAPPIVSNVLSSGGGQPLDAGTQQFMESRFGRDFSEVRVHTDSRAAESAAAIQARAYTSGRDVVFGQGEYRPGSVEGRRLLAHELGHVGQQGGVGLIMREDRDASTSRSNQWPNSAIRRIQRKLRDLHLYTGGTTGALDTQTQNALGQAFPEGTWQTLGWESVYQRLNRQVGNATQPDLAGPQDIQNELTPTQGLTEQRDLRQQKQIDTILSIMEFDKYIDRKLTSCNRAGRIVGNAYSNAINEHRNAIQGRGAELAARNQLYFSVLTIMSSGAFSWLGNTSIIINQMQALSGITRIPQNVIGDTLNASIGEISSLGPVYFPPIQDDSTNLLEPLEYQNFILNRIDSIRISKDEFISSLISRVRNASFEALNNINIEQNLNTWKSNSGFQNLRTNVPSQSVMAREFERGFWKGWIRPNLYQRSLRFQARTDTPYYTDEFNAIGSNVENRLNILGITQEAGVGTDFGWYTSDDDVRRIVRWARLYQIRRFD